MNPKERRRCIDILSIIKKTKSCDRFQTINCLKSDVIDFLSECTHNVLYTNFGLKINHCKKDQVTMLSS
jgi:hypothetical protein